LRAHDDLVLSEANRTSLDCYAPMRPTERRLVSPRFVLWQTRNAAVEVVSRVLSSGSLRFETFSLAAVSTPSAHARLSQGHNIPSVKRATAACPRARRTARNAEARTVFSMRATAPTRGPVPHQTDPPFAGRLELGNRSPPIADRLTWHTDLRAEGQGARSYQVKNALLPNAAGSRTSRPT
jgi:hypothetical protein